MCLFLYKVSCILLILCVSLANTTHAKSDKSHHAHRKYGKLLQVESKMGHEAIKRTQTSNKHEGAKFRKEANYRRSMKRQNVTEEKNSALLTRRAEDILLDEIKGSDQAASRAEIAYDIPKQLDYLQSSMKAGDISDIDTDKMISFNERKGAYLPVSQVKASIHNSPKRKLLTEEFKKITGLPEFMLKNHGSKLKKVKSASLVEKVADSLQPKVSALSGIKQLLEESKVEQSLKKHLDSMNANIINNIPNPPVPNEPSIVETSNSAESLNTVNLANGPQLDPAYITPISPDQMYDESISPPEQLLDELSTGKFKRPLSDTALEKMSEWNANKEFLNDNGLTPHDPELTSAKLTRVSSEMLPIHDLYLNQPPLKPTELISKNSLEFLKSDPEVLGRNQQILNGKQFHSLSDLDSIGPPIYPARVVHLPHYRPKHIYLPSKHVTSHLLGGNYHEDEDEGVVWPNQPFEDAVDDDGEDRDHFYHPHQPVYSARCSYKPCLNGGKCTSLTDKYVCTCREGFFGINCERRSYCFPTPCKHGTCSSNTDGFVCTCEPGYQGKRCEERDKCHPNPCMHGGTCTSTFSGIYCSCLSGFKGRYCESEAKCSPINPCLNGGRCQEMPSTYICICKNGFSGRNCDVILKPTSMPPSIDMKPAPPQAIPQPHSQPPFLLEELNSLNDGPLQEHPVPEVSFEATPIDDHHGHKVYNHHEEDHHFPDIFDEHYNDHEHNEHHEHSHLTISSSPAVVVHLGDRTKDDKKDKKKEDEKRKKKPPTDFKQDDRYVTHLVAAAPVKGKSADEEKQPAAAKKPPMEKPTAKQDKPKEGIPTAQTLMRLQNPKDMHMDDNRVYTDATGLDAHGGLNQLSSNAHGAHVYAKPAVKHVVEKGNKWQMNKIQKNGQFSKPKIQTKPAQKPRVVWAQNEALGKSGKQSAGTKAYSKKPEVVCPRFCKEFCDKWCVRIGCCKKEEVNEPTIANELLPGRANYATEEEVIKNAPLHHGKCHNCSEDADCRKGKCTCKEGFVGDGKQCKVNPCIFCHENASCNNGGCVCKLGYLGDGIQCTKFDDHCGRCSPYADCLQGFCLCKPGYYGNGNDCWPNTDPTL